MINLRTDSPYKKDDRVQGIVYEKSANFGCFVAVDDMYSALIPKKEVYKEFRVGERIEARVTEVKPDGKLNLDVREKINVQMEVDAKAVYELIEDCGGTLPFTDKADPEFIKEETGLSKAAFKRAVGKLLKEEKVTINEKSIAIRMK